MQSPIFVNQFNWYSGFWYTYAHNTELNLNLLQPESVNSIHQICFDFEQLYATTLCQNNWSVVNAVVVVVVAAVVMLSSSLQQIKLSDVNERHTITNLTRDRFRHSFIPHPLASHTTVCLYFNISVYTSAYLYVCLSVYLSVCLSTCLSVFLSVCLSVNLSICLSCICLSICLYFCLYICLNICLTICLTICLSICLHVYRSVYCLSFCLSLYLSICPNIFSLKNEQVNNVNGKKVTCIYELNWFILFNKEAKKCRTTNLILLRFVSNQTLNYY